MNNSSGFKYLPSHLAESVRNLGITMRRPAQGPNQGLHRSPDYGSSVEFAEYREYAPGDAINLIDWSVYARSDRYVIRRFHEETNVRAYLMLDTSASMGFCDEGQMSKMEYALHLAAALMYALVNQGDSVGLLTFDHKLQRTWAPVGTHEGLRPLLLGLEELGAGGRGDIEAAVHEAAEMIHSRSLVVVISDLLQDPAMVTRGIRHLFHDGHNVIVLHVMDLGERRLSFGGVAELRDMETGSKLVVDVDEIKDAYQTAVGRYLDGVRIGCTECLAGYHLIDTNMPLSDALNQMHAGSPG